MKNNVFQKIFSDFKKPIDFWLLFTVVILLATGLITMFSASMPYANREYGDLAYILKNQLKFALLGLVALFITANIDYHFYRKFTIPIFGFALFLLILVLVPGFHGNDPKIRRWLYIGPINFQPSEIMKIALIMFFAHLMSKYDYNVPKFFKGFLLYFVIFGIVAVLLIKEPHLSCTIIVFAITVVMLFCAGAKIFHFILTGIPALAGLAYVALFTDYMKERLLSFKDPFMYKSDIGWQVVQSLYAIGTGGLFGKGLGKSMQKFLYLPEPHNDFIFAIIAEELGFVGCVAILLLFLMFMWRGIRIALYAPDRYGSLIAVGITSLIGVQCILNIAVVTASVPATGVALPLFSYGGTALVLFLAEIGILLNISKYAKE
ncbi:MAG: putative lipid II flippase FtsW [Clostridiaceae bacterium]|jgi:cell division protein FtsW|nr:putative lipid II flippase FtsW [Clostridiaceae bacterium]